MWRQIKIINDMAAPKFVWARLEGQPREALLIVEADVGQKNAVLFHHGRKLAAFLRPDGSANLEQIGKVRSERNFDAHLLSSLVVVPYRQALITTGIPQKACPAHMNEIMLKCELALFIKEV